MSAPGRKAKWYVLLSIIECSILDMAFEVTPLIAPAVATGINTGVLIGPWGKVKIPDRASDIADG